MKIIQDFLSQNLDKFKVFFNSISNIILINYQYYFKEEKEDYTVNQKHLKTILDDFYSNVFFRPVLICYFCDCFLLFICSQVDSKIAIEVLKSNYPQNHYSRSYIIFYLSFGFQKIDVKCF